MNAAELRASILQLAIQGKLVPQHADEPAVEQIGEAPEDVPFAIPEKWKWVKFNEVIEIENGDRGQNYPAKSKLTIIDTGFPFVSALNLEKLKISKSSMLYMTEEQSSKLRSGHIKSGDCLLCIRGSLGKFGFADNDGGAIASSLVILRAKSRLDNGYLSALLQSPLFSDQIKKYKNGSAQPNLGAKNLALFYMPLPPLAEQCRIAERLNELLPLVNAYGKEYEALDKLNKEFPNKLRASFLQEAIQGKLVPQLESEPEVTQIGEAPEDVPFAIPEKWKWVEINEIIELISGRDLMASHISENESEGMTPYITGASQIENENIIINRWTSSGSVFSFKGDLLLTCKGTVGKIALNSVGKCHIARQIMAIRPNDKVTVEFAKVFFQYAGKRLSASAKSMIPGISRKDVLSLLFPLPPVEEQRRIVSRLNELLPLVDALAPQ